MTGLRAGAWPGVLLACTLTHPPIADAGAAAREFQDCDGCPVMIEIPAGRFMMGSVPEETQVPGWPEKAGGNERPRHEVTIARSFALGRYEVTRAQYGAFVADAGYADTGGCVDFSGGSMSVVAKPENSWRNPGFAQRDDEPALCVSWLDAQAYVAWLARRTGQHYRLPAEAEWEYAARAGTTTTYPWGNGIEAGCRHLNARADAAWRPDPARPAEEAPYPCDDGARTSAPVGSYAANAFGLHDMVGNVFEWMQDCNHRSYEGAPADGSAWVDDESCVFRVMRGGSFANGPRQTRSASRAGRPVSGRAPMLGFRVAKTLGGGPAATAGVPAVNAAGWAAAEGPDAALFRARCAACHLDPRTFAGVYGRDQTSVEKVIREGGTNSMSMPAWRGELTDAEITRLASYVRAVAGWN